MFLAFIHFALIAESFRNGEAVASDGLVVTVAETLTDSPVWRWRDRGQHLYYPVEGEQLRTRSVKKRTSDPWIPGDRYGRILPPFMVNLLVRNIERAIPFYRDVLGGLIHYADPDFAAIKVGAVELMLHADHTYDKHPWHERLIAGEPRGLGAELRLFGVDPDAVEARARGVGATIVSATSTRGHGWREVMVEDADGYLWAVGIPAEKP